MSSQNIVIVGAGSSGYPLQKQLTAKLANTDYNIVVIEPRIFFLHKPATLRMVVSEQDEYQEKALMNYPSDVESKKVRFIYGSKVTSIVDNGNETGGKVTLDNETSVDYSILILASGSRWSGPISFGTTKAEISETVNTWRAKFKEAQDIVLVGGGAIGFELSGEIKDIWPDKNVTIVHRQPLPLNNAYPDSWRKDVAKKYRKRGITLEMNDGVADLEPKDGKIVTNGGKSITADLVVPTYGSTPNTEYVKSLGSDALSEAGYVKVKPTLQLVNHPRIFAIGDIIEWEEQNQVMKTMSHISIVLNNVLTVIGQQKKGLKNYDKTFEGIFLSNGRNGGAAFLDLLWGITFGDGFTKLVKSKTLLVGMTKSSMGL